MFSRFASARRRFTATDARALGSGLVASLSIGAAYVPIAISFGLVAVRADLSPVTAILVSCMIFAGASQFVLVSLLASGAGFLGALATVLLMNARHVFYGPSLMRKLPSKSARLPLPLLAAGLTDEVFATSMARLDRVPKEDREMWHLGLQAGAYAAWVLGTAIGVVSGAEFAHLPKLAQYAVQFVLPALFMALLLDLISRDRAVAVMLSAATTLAGLCVLPSYQVIPLGMLVGALGAGRKESRHA